MRESVRYGTAAALLIAIVTLALWPFLEGPGRTGVLVAGAIAFPVQLVSFSLLVRFRGHVNGFLKAWACGMVIRVVALVATAVVAVRSAASSAVPLLLALAGFFFGLLVLEPMYFRAAPRGTA